MCKKCEEAANVLAKILPIEEEPDKLREWAVKQQSTDPNQAIVANEVVLVK